MGPRLFSRGKSQEHGWEEALDDQLQWGRGSSAAEMCYRPVKGYGEEQLQWGRGSSAAEMISAAPPGWQVSVLHGAAALQPREMALLATSYHYCHYVYDFER